MAVMQHPGDRESLKRQKLKIKGFQREQAKKEKKGRWVKVENGIQNIHKFIEDGKNV